MLKRIALFAALALLNSLNAAQVKVLAPEAITNLVNSRISTISGRVSVKDYGALGDGVADDTVAFYDALSAATLTKGKVVYIPPGIYLVNIVLNSAYNGLTLESDASGPGVGSSSPYLRPYNTAFPTVTVGDDVNIVTGLTLRNLIISGQNGSNYSDYALKLIGAYENTFTDLAIYAGKRASLYVTSNLKPCYYNYFQRLTVFPYLPDYRLTKVIYVFCAIQS